MKILCIENEVIELASQEASLPILSAQVLDAHFLFVFYCQTF